MRPGTTGESSSQLRSKIRPARISGVSGSRISIFDLGGAEGNAKKNALGALRKPVTKFLQITEHLLSDLLKWLNEP